MDNKELPQEIVKQIERKILDIKRAYSIACLVAPDEELQAYKKWAEYGAITTNTYCNSIIDGKDKEIEQLTESLIANANRASDQRIEILEQKAEIERITELLKEMIYDDEYALYSIFAEDNEDAIAKDASIRWEAYKKEHNL